MSSFDISLGIIGALAFVLGAFLYAVLASAWRIVQDDGELRLERMLRRKGVPPTAMTSAGYQGATAMRRCVACAEKEECERWLASGSHGSIAKFCPNARLIEQLAHSR
jgi:hypothetical protein